MRLTPLGVTIKWRHFLATCATAFSSLEINSFLKVLLPFLMPCTSRWTALFELARSLARYVLSPQQALRKRAQDWRSASGAQLAWRTPKVSVPIFATPASCNKWPVRFVTKYLPQGGIDATYLGIFNSPETKVKSFLIRSACLKFVFASADFFILVQSVTLSTRCSVLQRVGAIDDLSEAMNIFHLNVAEPLAIASRRAVVLASFKASVSHVP